MSTPIDDRQGDSQELNDAWRVVTSDAQRLTHLLRAAADEATPAVRQELELILQHLNRATGHDSALPDDRRLVRWLPVLVHAVRTKQPMSAVRSIAAELSIDQRASQNDGQGRWTGLYLLTVLGLAGGVALLVSRWILPAFAEMFTEFGIELPAITVGLLRAGEVLNSPVVQSIAVVGLAGLMWVWWRPHSRIGQRLRQFIHGLDGVDRARTWSRSAENLALLIEAGYDWPSAQRLAALSASSTQLGRVGTSLGPSDSSLTPTIRWTETEVSPSQVQVDVLRTLSAIYADRATARRNELTNLIGPLGIVVVGILVGITVIGLFAPLVRLISNLS